MKSLQRTYDYRRSLFLALGLPKSSYHYRLHRLTSSVAAQRHAAENRTERQLSRAVWGFIRILFTSLDTGRGNHRNRNLGKLRYESFPEKFPYVLGSPYNPVVLPVHPLTFQGHACLENFRWAIDPPTTLYEGLVYMPPNRGAISPVQGTKRVFVVVCYHGFLTTPVLHPPLGSPSINLSY